MPSYKHQVVLSCKQRKRLKALSKRGEVSARKLTRAHIRFWQTKTVLKVR